MDDKEKFENFKGYKELENITFEQFIVLDKLIKFYVSKKVSDTLDNILKMTEVTGDLKRHVDAFHTISNELTLEHTKEVKELEIKKESNDA